MIRVSPKPWMIDEGPGEHAMMVINQVPNVTFHYKPVYSGLFMCRLVGLWSWRSSYEVYAEEMESWKEIWPTKNIAACGWFPWSHSEVLPVLHLGLPRRCTLKIRWDSQLTKLLSAVILVVTYASRHTQAYRHSQIIPKNHWGRRCRAQTHAWGDILRRVS